ncbi:MAG: alanine:cation symporter family protein [Corynebacterium nuruki]|nr:alanine:cation symporter family protein [Corynebacterium nuruki]
MDLITKISDWIWNPLAYFALAVGLLFTFITRGVQFRRLPDMIKQLKESGSGDGGLSSFQTLALTLSSRVGVGSIAGVATAITMGGPGAMLWLIITGLLGSTCAYAEAVLAQTFKRRVHGEDRGGMPYYIRYGLKAPGLAATIALTAMIGYGFVFPGIQANNIASSMDHAFSIPAWVTGLVIAGVLGFVVIGGTKRIVNVAQTVVPFMAIGYLIVAAVIICANISEVPEALRMIIMAGMGSDQLFGGLIGFAVAWGVRRAVFASATGFGEGTFSAAAANTTHPGKQGIIQAFSIYIDLFMICTATGLMIMVTGKYNVQDSGGGFIVEGAPGTVPGPNYVQEAIDATFNGFGSVFVAVAVLLFAFTSQVFFFYVSMTNLIYLLGDRVNRLYEGAIKVGAVAIAFIGSVASADAIWAIGDIGYAILAWLNMIAVVLLTPVVRKIVRDYDAQRKAGVDPVFIPEKVGISDAVWWENEFREREKKRPRVPDPVSPDPAH